ncbi:Endonuclease/exonuclease/phosphatase [Clohesyomyces aquaticus]|uniref:Endonuclease/exonuclease/phosphatase n=1 Tax=Clohesyomyces aquaticus TaxID=1231657 RepID=A0A1Y1Z7X8_9PLEO|nr:Endonuclease/exonuclease/phosphatase [Clohesyomyces aquaticus]
MHQSISPPPSKRPRTCEPSNAPTTASRSLSTSITADPNSFRVFSWNINGITPFLQNPITSYFHAPESPHHRNENTRPASLRGFLQRHNWPAVLFLQEVKISRTDTKTQDAVKAAVNTRIVSERGAGSDAKEAPQYEVYFTLPNDRHNARGLRNSGKVYGVCSIIRSDMSTSHSVRHRTVNWDREGRVSVLELCAPNNCKLALFNVYAVNGTDNPYRDPQTGTVIGTRHDRKLIFHELLMEECMQMESLGWKVLLGGDFNVAPDERDGFPKLRTWPPQHVANREDFLNRFLEEGKGLGAVDVWRMMHGEDRRYTYFPRSREWASSCDRVDYFVAGRSVWNGGMVRGCGILDSEVERGPSDHVPFWVDIGFGTGNKD